MKFLPFSLNVITKGWSLVDLGMLLLCFRFDDCDSWDRVIEAFDILDPYFVNNKCGFEYYDFTIIDSSSYSFC